MNIEPVHHVSLLHRRWLWLVLLLLSVASVVTGLLIAGPWAQAPAAQSKTVWQEISSGITGGQVPKQTALEAFAYLYHVTIPGVQVPAGRNDGQGPSSGTGVVSWVQNHWAELTPAQQAVIDPFITQGPNDVVRTFDASGSIVPGLLPLARTTAPAAIAASAYPIFDATVVEILTDIQHLGPKLGIPTISGSVTLDFSDQDGWDVQTATPILFTTHGHYDLFGGVWRPCKIIVYRNTWSKMTLKGDKLADPLHVLLTHEVIHCYQQVIWGSVATANKIPAWITEGTALWLAGNDTGSIEPYLPMAWNLYFNAETDLFNRAEDAVGFYDLLAHKHRNLWGLIPAAWRAAGASSDPSDAFIAVLDGDASDIRDAWAPGYLRKADWKDPWVTDGFGLGPETKVTPRVLTATNPGAPGNLESRSNSIAQVVGSAGEVVTVETTGLVSAHDDSDHIVLSFQSKRLCTVESCVCKPGTLRAGEDMAEQQMRLPFMLAFNAPKGGSSYVVTGRTLEELCGQKPCAAQKCAGDNGDPHLLTVDGHRYDFQAAGEFTLLRSTDGTLEIQGRQEPYNGSDHVTINTAIAARVGSHRIGVYLTSGGLELRADGVATTLTAPLDLGSGGRVIAYPKGYEIDFPDGTTMWTMSLGALGAYGINAQIQPSSGLVRGVNGLLGPVPPAGLGVPSLPDGTRLPRAADNHTAYVELYQTFADAWRVTDTTSLFDYAPGTSTTTFAKALYPVETAAQTLATLPGDRQAAAQLQCVSVTDPDLRDQCAFDFAVTGEPGLVDQYLLTQQFLAQGPTSLGPTVAATSAPDGPPSSASPVPSLAPRPTGITKLIPLVINVDGAVFGPDGTMYLSVELPEGQFEVVAIDPRQGRITHRIATTGAGLLAFASGSIWLGGTTASSDCTITRLDPTTLAGQAPIAVPCDLGRSVFTSRGQAIWFVDQSAVDSSGSGVLLRMIDPTTNRPSATGAALHYANGSLSSSPDSTAIVYGDVGKDVQFLAAGSTQFQSLGKLAIPLFAVAPGVWTDTFGTSSGTGSASLVGPGGTLATVPIDGPVVGANDRAVYVNGQAAADGSDTLWRYPADGSVPIQIAQGSKIDTDGAAADLGYFDNAPFLVGAHQAVKIWLVPSSINAGLSAVDIQWVALP